MRAARLMPVIAAVGLALTAAPAGAAVQADFALAPASTQAGSSADIAADVRLSSPDGDDVKDVTISLAHGLLASPFAIKPCDTSAFESDTCDPKAQIGQGIVTATAFGTTVATPARVYLITPQSSEIARIGMVLKTPFGRLKLSAPVAIRTSPDLGVDIPFTNILRDVEGVAITIDRIELTLSGRTATGEPFVRLPTRCAPASSRLTIASYGGATATAAAAFTPTGCDALPFNPGATASAALDDAGGLAFSSTITTGPNDAATSRVAFALPDGIVARPSVLARACSAPDPATCPATATVGSAAALTTFAPVRLAGRIVLTARQNALPGLTVVFPPPFALRIDGSTGVSPAGTISTTFDGLPDVPITSLEVKLDGGAGSLLAPEREICSTKPMLTGEVAGHHGGSVPVATPVTVSGCVGGELPKPKPAPTGTPKASLTLRGLAGTRRRLALAVSTPATARTLKRIDVCLPEGLALRRRGLRTGLRVAAGGRRVRTGTVRGRCLRLTIPGAGSRKVTVTLRAAAFRVGPRLARRVRARRGGRLTVAVAATDAAAHVTRLRAGATAR